MGRVPMLSGAHADPDRCAEKDRAFPVEEDFDAPVANAPYYYRLCAEDSENAGNPACGDVKTFNTAAP